MDRANLMQVYMVSALLGRFLPWNLSAGFVVVWIIIHCSAHMLPPNPSGPTFMAVISKTHNEAPARENTRPCRS